MTETVADPRHVALDPAIAAPAGSKGLRTASLAGGGLGVAPIYGGAGDDTYFVDDEGDQVVEAPGEGNDTVETTLLYYQLPDNVENLTGISTPGEYQRLIGNELDNVIDGGTGNSDIQLGVGGHDTVIGGTGDDFLFIEWGDSTSDVKIAFIATDAAGAASGTYSDGAARSVAFSEVEGFRITTGSGNDRLLVAGAGSVRSGAGNDSVWLLTDQLGADGGSGDGDGLSVDLSSATFSLQWHIPTNQYFEPGLNQRFTSFEYLFDVKTGSGADRIETGHGVFSDNITSGAGNDEITFYDGYDTAHGGEGSDDLLVVDWRAHGGGLVQVTGFASPGAVGRVSPPLGRRVDFDGIERLWLLTGDEADLIRGSAGGERFSAGGGDDRLTGGGGIDWLNGGSGSDTADYSLESGAGSVQVNLQSGGVFGASGLVLAGLQARDSFGYLDSLSGIENVKTGGGNDSVYGDDLANVIETGSGNDFLLGGGGIDTLIGGAGDDVYSIRSVDGPAFDDSIVELESGGIDEVRSGLASFSLAGLANVEKLTGFGTTGQSLTGNSLGNLVRASSGSDLLAGAQGDDMLDGGTGADEMRGGADNDIFIVEDAGDVVVEFASEGTDEVRTVLGAGPALAQRIANQYQLAANVENLTGIGLGQGLRGNALDNVIAAGAGADFINASDGGNDTVSAGDGRDVIYYGAAMTMADGSDAGLDGGDARGDLLILQGDYSFGLTLGANAIVDVEKLRLLKGVQTDFGDTGGNLYSYDITTVDANVGDGDQLVVQAGSLQLGEHLSFDGSDESDGSFQVFGGHDDDRIEGGDQFDHLLGRAGDDHLIGNGGADRLRGGLGQDLLEGGAGADIFVYSAQGGAEGYSNAALESTGIGYDTIDGFTWGEDVIDLPTAVTAIGTDTSGSLSEATFDTDLTAALGSFAASSAVLFTADAGDLAGRHFLVVDADGSGGYEGGNDFVIHLLNPVGTVPAAADVFI